MKLYLSSYLIPDLNQFIEFVGKNPKSIKIGLIVNAKDDKELDEKKIKINRAKNYFKNLGFNVEKIDLKDYFDKDSLKETLMKYDVIWVIGGNTYSLRWAMEKSNFKNSMKNAFASGVIYAGDSAGAIVAGPTLKYFDIVDNASSPPETIYEGLNFVDFSILPHSDSDKFKEAIISIKKKLLNNNYKTINLNDNEFVLCENGSFKKLQKESE